MLERSVDNIIKRFDKDDRERELENLATANQELLECNEKLRKAFNELQQNKTNAHSLDEK